MPAVVGGTRAPRQCRAGPGATARREVAGAGGRLHACHRRVAPARLPTREARRSALPPTRARAATAAEAGTASAARALRFPPATGGEAQRPAVTTKAAARRARQAPGWPSHTVLPQPRGGTAAGRNQTPAPQRPDRIRVATPPPRACPDKARHAAPAPTRPAALRGRCPARPRRDARPVRVVLPGATAPAGVTPTAPVPTAATGSDAAVRSAGVTALCLPRAQKLPDASMARCGYGKVRSATVLEHRRQRRCARAVGCRRTAV